MFLCTMTRNSECDRFTQAEDNMTHYCRGNETTAKFYKTWQNQERLITVITAHRVRFIQRCVKLSGYRMFEYFTWACLTEQVRFRMNNNVIHYSGQISPITDAQNTNECVSETHENMHTQAGSQSWLTSSDDPLYGDERDVDLLGKFVHCLVGIFVGEGVNVGTHPRELDCRHTCGASLPFRCHWMLLTYMQAPQQYARLHNYAWEVPPYAWRYCQLGKGMFDHYIIAVDNKMTTIMNIVF